MGGYRKVNLALKAQLQNIDKDRKSASPGKNLNENK